MTLKLVKPGEPLPEDETKAERLERAKDASAAIMAAAEADGDFWLLVTGENEMHVSYLGDSLEMACVAEEVARRLRLAEIGFSPE